MATRFNKGNYTSYVSLFYIGILNLKKKLNYTGMWYLVIIRAFESIKFYINNNSIDAIYRPSLLLSLYNPFHYT